VRRPFALLRTARRLGAALIVSSLALGGAAAAQGAPAADALYQDLGGRASLERLMDRFVDALYADTRIARHFKDTKPAFLKKQLTDQLCQVAGGPCVYDGETMKKSHQSLGITRADFNALVEDLQIAMDAHGIPFAVQNRLLARLAPMHRDIVTR
jgi:hemoglobin